MYKANIYLKYCQKKHAYAAPSPLKGGLTHGLPFSNLVLICALAPLPVLRSAGRPSGGT